MTSITSIPREFLPTHIGAAIPALFWAEDHESDPDVFSQNLRGQRVLWGLF